MRKDTNYVVGVDEVGRGPLAGPVAVGVAAVSEDFDWSLLPGVTDSKKLSPKRREDIFKEVKKQKKAGKLDFAVAQVSAKTIDRIGIVPSITLAMERALKQLKLDPSRARIKLDGGLIAPKQYNQETIIKGDQKEKVIGLASICAKETRDAYMMRIATDSQFAVYDFATHKGYGTKNHREIIKVHGVSVEHRNSFCRNCM
jgi:ribonuclease HII